MTSTETPPQPIGTRSSGPKIALIAVAAVAVAAAGILVLTVLGVLFVTPVTSEQAPPPSAPVIEPALANGELFGYISEIGDGTIIVDPAEMLTGRAAHDAAVEPGIITEDEDLPNDFYIANPEAQTVSIAVAPDAELTVLTLDANGMIEETPITLSRLASALAGVEEGMAIYGLDSSAFPVSMTIGQGAVTALSQVYLP